MHLEVCQIPELFWKYLWKCWFGVKTHRKYYSNYSNIFLTHFFCLSFLTSKSNVSLLVGDIQCIILFSESLKQSIMCAWCQNLRRVLCTNQTETWPLVYWFLILASDLRYSNADLKISLFIRVHIKTIPWIFCVVNPRNSRVIYP